MRIVMPSDRTTKIPAQGFCRNPQCQEKEGELFEFAIEHAHVECPKCKANKSPMVGIYTLTHFLVQVEGGPIRGAGGVSYALACDQQRAYLATVTNLEAASGDITCVNCPQCIENAEKLGIRKPGLWTPGA